MKESQILQQDPTVGCIKLGRFLKSLTSKRFCMTNYEKLLLCVKVRELANAFKIQLLEPLYSFTKLPTCSAFNTNFTLLIAPM